MSVTKEDVMKVSRLAKIKVSDHKVDELCNNLNNILNFVEQLSEVDCSGVDNSVEYATKLHERTDVALQTDPEGVMANAPEKECNMFVVPKVIA